MSKSVILLLILFSGSLVLSAKPVLPDNENTGKPVISGYVRDKANGEALVGASVYIKENNAGTITNVYGFYSLSLDPGTYTIVFSYIGYESIEQVISLKQSTTLNMEIGESSEILKEVVIAGEKKDENITENRTGLVKMDVEQIKKVPAFMGETDIIKSIQLLPGIQTAAEGFSGFNVRGGSADQNLILLDEAAVYNASHLLGFFSVFNSDAIRDVKIYKGDIPAEYGGRLSSLLDIRMKEGNLKKYEVTGGIGTIASRVTVEGPIIKDKASFIVSGRRTYADIFLPLAPDSNLHDNRLYFYDLSLKANYNINPKNRIYVSGYFGRDVFRMKSLMDMYWGNATETVRWNHLFSDKLFSNFSFIISDYTYVMNMDMGGTKFRWESGIMDYGTKGDFNFYANTKNTIKFGYLATYHTFVPGEIESKNTNSSLKIPRNYSLEYGFYVSNEQKINDRLSVGYGIRLSAFQNIGKTKYYSYDENHDVADTTFYNSGEIYKTYIGPEPRFNMTWIADTGLSFKASYSRTRQYVQMASNSAAGMPTDIWFSCSPNIKPQLSDQAAIGVFKNLRDNTIELSVETYYKNMTNQVDFCDNANLFLNEFIEGEVRIGKAVSYGLELMVRKNKGLLTGWISYTLSKSQRKIDDINNNDWYPASYDKPHNLTIVGTYEITERVSAGLVWIYSTGAPVSLPTGRWVYGNTVIPSYSERNGYRLPDYHRLDFSLTIRLQKKLTARFQNELNISVYNLYNRKNAFTIYFEPDKNNPDKMQAYKMSMFGIVPAITWNFKF